MEKWVEERSMHHVNKIHRAICIILMTSLSLFLSCAYNGQMQIGSKGAEYYSNRGEACLEKGRLDKAIVNFNKALEINPRYANAYYNRGNVYMIRWGSPILLASPSLPAWSCI
jgi:tetratricopeptide (TPR) repeat protein